MGKFKDWIKGKGFIPIAMITSAFVLYGTSVNYHQNIARADVSHGSAPFDLNHYKGSGANFGVSELLTGSGSKGTAMIISLDNGPSGASYIGLNNSGELTKMQDAYGARAMGANESSLAFVGTSVSNNDIFNKYTAQYWGAYSDSTYNMEDMSSTHRMIRSNTGSSVDIKDPYFDTYWYTNGELNNNVSTSDLLKKNSKGEYAFEAVVNTVSQQTNREIWCTLADMDDSGKDPQEILNSKWFDIDTSLYNDTKSMSQVEKQRQSLKYIDMLMSLYSASKGTVTESEWRNALINYLTSNGGSIGQNTDNKTNIVFSRGLIWGTEKTEGVSNEDYLTCANGADLVSFLYRIDLADDTREPAVAEEYYKTIGADLSAIYKNAWRQSRANGLADGFWRDIEYWNKIISSLVGTSPEGASFALDRYRALDTVAVNSSKGAHKGISVINNLPLSVTRKSQVTPVKAFWSIDNQVNVQKTELTYGNAWTELDNNKMYNSGAKTERESIRYYKDSTANSKKMGKLVDTINENIGLSINGKFGSNIDANNIIDNNDVFTVRVKIARNTNASNPKTVDYYLAGNQYRSDSEITLDNLNWNKDNLRQFLLGQKNLDVLLDKSTKDQIVKNGTTVNFSYSVVVTVSYGTSSNDMTDIEIKGDSNKVYVTRKDVPILKGGIHRVEFHSIPVAYSELKEGTVQMGDGTSSNETWEAMAGVPSTESLYFTAGGSEFIAEVHMSYIPKERAKRYYHTHFSGTDCEYKTADQAGTYSNSGYSGGNGNGAVWNPKNSGGNGSTAIPTINKTFGSGDAKVTSESYTVNGHSGGTYSVTISGTIHNDAPATVEADGMGEATANNPHKSRPADMQSRAQAYQKLTDWINEMKATELRYKASSDNVTRVIKLSTNGCSSSLPSMPTNEPADTSAYDGWNSHTEGEGESAHEVLDPAHASAPKGADVSWTVTATVSVPAHVLCGPCCNHSLPALEDNWTQVSEYSYMRVDSARIWKIDRAYVDGMNEVTYTKQNNVVADLAQGEPTLWYNIADEYKDYYDEAKKQQDYYAVHGELQKKVFALHPARAGRIIYSLEPEQYDNVSWNEGTRSNRCNGDAGCGTLCSTNPCKVEAGLGRANIKNENAPDPKTGGALYTNAAANKNDNKGQCFAIGCLYSNTDRENNDETWFYHQARGDKLANSPIKGPIKDDKGNVIKDEHGKDVIGTIGYNVGGGTRTDNTIDRYDMESPEFLRFKNRRQQWNYIVVMSDMLVMQTTQGDQALYYYPGTQWREADHNFDYDDDAAMGKNNDDIGSSSIPGWYQWFISTQPDSGSEEFSLWKTISRMDDNKNPAMDEGTRYDERFKMGQPHTQTIQGYIPDQRRWIYATGNNVSEEENKGEELYGYGLDYLYRSYESMWDLNNSSASKWDPQYTINISGYNGNVGTPKNKFSKHLTDDFDTLFDDIGNWENAQHLEDSADISYYTDDIQYNHLGNQIEIISNLPNIDSAASDDGSGGDNQNIREFLNSLTDPWLDKTGNNVVINPTDGSASRFRGISGDGHSENVINYSFGDVNPPDGHYIRSNFNKAKYENGEWNKDIDSMDSNDYEYKTTMYRSSPFTTNSSSSGLDGMTDTVGSIHHQSRVDRPSSSLKILVDRVHPWAVQNGWNKDKKTYQHGIRQDATNENREYTVGNGHVFYRQILNYTRPAIETGKYEFKYNYSNTTVSALGNKSGVVVDAPYSKNHNSINSIVVHDPVSVDGAFLIGLDSKRDQRTDGSGVSSAASMLEKLEASKVCPGTAALCEFRHLDCKYFKEVDIANFKIEPSRIINTKNGVAYSYPNMITYDSDEEAIKFKSDSTTSIDVPFSDLGIEFSNSMTIKADFSMKMDEDTKKAIDDASKEYFVTPIAFGKYSIMVHQGQIMFNTANGISYTADAKNLFDNQWHDYNVEFSFDDVANSKLTIDGKEIALVKKQDASDITSSLVGSNLKIGWGGNIKQAPYLLKNIQLTKLSGTAHHTKSCYKEVTVHSSTVQYVAKPQKFSFTGDTQHFTVPETGRYLIQAYGASGGDSYGGSMDNYSSTGGLGGYATGIAYLEKGEVLDVVVGGQGTASSGGYPCGGKASSNVYGGGSSSWVLGNRVYVESQIGSTSSNSYIKNGKVKFAPVYKTPMRKNKIKISVKGEGLDDRQIRIVGVGDGTQFAVVDKYTPSNNKYISKSVDKHDEVTFEADITKEVLDFKVQVYYTSSKTRVDSVTISSSMCPIIEAGGGGGAGKTGQNAAKGSSVDNSGGAGGGVQGGAPRKNGTVVTASAGKLGNPYTGEGIGAGYYYGLPSGGTGGSGGGSSFVAGLEQPFTTPGVNCGNGEVIITSLEPQNAPDSMKKTIQSKNNIHVHTADCVTGTNKVDFKNNAALIGAFYQDTYGDSTALKQILGTTLYNKYKSSNFNQTLKTGTMTYNYTGKVQKLSIPEAGLYTFDVYGASGGGANGTGGKGGHVTGSIVLQPKDNIYLYVGQQGSAQQSTANGTYYGAYMGGGVGSIRAYGGGGMSLVTTDPNADTLREYAKKEVKTVTYDEVDPTKGTLLASDDDGGSGYSAQLSVKLTKGTKYLFCIGAYSASRHGTYSWTFTGPSTNLSGTDKVDSGEWSNKTFDVDCVHTFTAPETGTYNMHVAAGSGDPCAYVTTYATTKKTKTTEVYDTNHSGKLDKTKALLVGAGGGGATNSGAKGGNSQNSQNGNTAQGDGNGQSVSRQVISSPQTKSYTLSEPIYVKCADGVGRYLVFEGGNTGTITLNKSHRYVLANHTSGCTYGTSKYRSNGWLHIFDLSNNNKCITCGHTCGYDASTSHALDIKVANLFREVDKNKNHDGFLDSCGGGGGAGYVGGNSGATETAGGYGGVNFVGNSATKLASVEAGNTGNGKIIVNYTSSASLQTIYNAITNVIAPNVSLAPLTVNGGTNPLFICDGTFNQHKCDANCKTENILACSEPHHRSPASHYPGSNPVCWAPCGHTDPEDPNNPHAHNHDEAEIDGAMKRLGTFVNVDYKFQIYFPNIGDFEQNPNLRGLSAVTDIRGKSYKDSMDTTKWIREKRVKFGFDVLFKNTNTGKWEEYKAGTWISLPIFKDKQTFDKQYSEFSNTDWFKENAMEVYDFYCLGSNVDIASASIQYEAEAVNAEGSPGGKSSPYLRKITNRIEERNVDNTSYTSNRTRNVSLMAKHSASKKSYADVVGRIGNLFITDTDDLRFANFFKETTDTGWLIDGVIRKVNQAVQNNYLSWHTHDGKAYEDIRGELVKPETGMYNTWMMQNWLEDKGYMLKQDKYVGSTSVELPLTSAKNNITQLLGDKFKPGYNVLFEISTLGSYSDKLQVLPYFYALDTEHDKLYPVDVYMEADTEYVPINYYNGLPKSSDSDDLKKEKQKLIDEESDYVLNLDWVREAERRNYTAPEKLITTYITDNYSYLVGSSGIRHPLLSPDTILGTGKKALGTIQLLNVDGNARTFIGSTYTQRENFNKDAKDNTNTGTFSSINYKGGYHFTNLDNLIYRDRFWTGAQRWHLKLGLPSSAVFVKYYNDNVRHKPTDLLRNEDGTPKTDENGSQILKMEEVQNGKYAILMTADIYAYGDTFILHYDQGVENGVITINGKKYTFGDNFNGQEIKGTVLGVYDADSTSTVDIDIQGSH